MKTKFLNFLLFASTLFILQSCGQSYKIDSHEITETQNDEAIKTLKEFYTAYMLEMSSGINQKAEDSILNKYVTEELLIKIEKASLDYDPLINAQDAIAESIETLRVTSDEKQKEVYNVCYTDVYSENGKKYCIELSLIKRDGRYMINDILNEDLSEE